jgi:AraC-like DNA-binding protein
MYFNDDENFVVAYYRQIEEIVNVIFSLFLFVKAYSLLFMRTVLYQEILTFDTIKWLKKFMIIATVIMFSWILAVIFNLDKALHPQTFIYFPLRLSCSILVFWLAYEGFFNYSLLSERMQLRKVIETNRNKRKIIPSHGLVETKSSKYKIIKEHIETNCSYLNPEYSLENLASELKMSTSSLSQAINNESNHNFSDYINSLRVEKAKDFLIASEYSSYTILAIGLECGFNSKSTFYSAFKKFTNCTPSEFRSKTQN